MVIVVGNEHGDPISNTGFASICEDVCISHNAYSVGNGMNLAILPQVMSKLYGRLLSLTFVWQSVKRENSGLKPVKLRIRIDLVSHPAHEEKLLNSHTHTHTYRVSRIRVRSVHQNIYPKGVAKLYPMVRFHFLCPAKGRVNPSFPSFFASL